MKAKNIFQEGTEVFRSQKTMFSVPGFMVFE